MSSTPRKRFRPVKSSEKVLEYAVFSARWLLAPFYLGMIIALAVLLVKFVEELWHLMIPTGHVEASQVVLGVLSLVDLSLIANLLIIVIFSGYENFISKIEVAKNHADRPSWMGRVDFGGLKMKVIGSLVAISSIELLKDFIESSHGEAPVNIKWRIYIHLVFLASGVLFAVMDIIAAKREIMEAQHHVGDSHSD
jgi:uncharacterized protein (TIGR00645 family)